MKVSASAPPEAPPSAGWPRPLAWNWRSGGWVVAAAYLLAHLPFLAPSLEDYDSINFALGLRDFDPSRHQPHPPGSPVYIALGRALLAPIAALWPSLGRVAAEALTLALWSAVAGAVAIVSLVAVFGALTTSGSRHVPLWGAAFAGAAPLFWISGLRPMSDLVGLAAALAAQALILQGRAGGRRLVAGAWLSGVAAGIRVQTVWLTVPLLAVAIVMSCRSRRTGAAAGPWRQIGAPAAALAAGGLLWAVPLIADGGGLAGYLATLRSQAGEDFAWVDMLWLNPTPRRLAFALYETFVLPWAWIPLAAAVAVAAVAGAVAMILRERAQLALLLVAFAPYVVFHLLLQETLTVRYALPTLPLVAWLAARGLAVTGRFMAPLAAAVVIAALAIEVPAAVAYGREPHPAFRAVAEASLRAGVSPPGAVHAHHSVWRALSADPAFEHVPEPARLYEWLGPVTYWKQGGTAPVWFFADPRRTDLALIDPQTRLDVSHYRWAVADRLELGGSRPVGADWYRMAAPGWFAEEGWSLTPETGGLARASAKGPDHRPVHAWVRRRPGPLHLMVGGRHLGDPGDPPAEFELAVDGVLRDRWRLTLEDRNFLRFLNVPDGVAAGEGAYAPLTIVSRAIAGGGRRAPVAVRQFDIQSADRMLYAFGEGWHEEEYDAATGRRWRWTSGRSVLRLKGAQGGVAVRLRAESPLRYFDAPPAVRVRVGGRVIAERRPDADFEWTVTVPAADLARGDGAIVIETAPVYLPGPAEGSTDVRQLGLRIFECTVSTLDRF